MPLEQYLQTIGLDDKEAKVYLANLQLGPSPIQAISKQSGIKRSTVYEVVKTLKDKGLLNATQRDKKKLFVAEEPNNLILYLKQKEKVLQEILPDLEALKNINASRPAIRIFEGELGIEQIYEDMIKKPGEILAFAAPKGFISLTLLRFLQQSWEPRRIAQGVAMKRININNTGRAGNNYKRRHKASELEEVYYLPVEHYPFSVGIYVYRSKVAFVSYQKQEMVGIVIRSPEINKTMKMMFEMFYGKKIEH
jgi:sugar-specific transcriptional regulator TrmB